MEKDFDGWNGEKKLLHAREAIKFCHVREIWWCALGINIGEEQDGKGGKFERPVLILRKFNEHIFFVVALIGKKKEGKYYFPLGVVGDREASAVLSQVRLIDVKRLRRKLSVLDEELSEKLKDALRRALFGDP